MMEAFKASAVNVIEPPPFLFCPVHRRKPSLRPSTLAVLLNALCGPARALGRKAGKALRVDGPGSFLTDRDFAPVPTIPPDYGIYRTTHPGPGSRGYTPQTCPCSHARKSPPTLHHTHTLRVPPSPVSSSAASEKKVSRVLIHCIHCISMRICMYLYVCMYVPYMVCTVQPSRIAL